VTREEAQRLCEKLSREHADRQTHSWLPRERDGEWSVMKVSIPPAKDVGDLAATTEERPKPPSPGDPRSGPLRDIPPVGGA
jgi:hypothetical protein